MKVLSNLLFLVIAVRLNFKIIAYTFIKLTAYPPLEGVKGEE